MRIKFITQFCSAFLLLGLAQLSQAQTSSNLPPPIYQLKEDAPAVGSNIKRRATPDFIIPINRRYQELSKEEKAKFNSLFDDLDVGDEPPFPEDGLHDLFRVIRKLRDFDTSIGELNIKTLINEKGEAELVKVYGVPQGHMMQIITNALVVIKYKPALCQGEPCKMEFPLHLQFPLSLAMRR
jgi:hypothetical protein